MAVLAKSAREACSQACRGLSKQGDVDNVRANVTPEGYGPVIGESTRRCKGDRWDGEEPGKFLVIMLRDSFGWVVSAPAAEEAGI